MLHALRFAVRSLRKSPGFTVLAALMLALGIGASTACFSFLHAFFFRPPPFERPAELVSLHTVEDRTPGLMRLSYPNFTDYRAQNTAFTDLAFHMWTGLRWTNGAENADLFGQLVSENYFELLGVRPALGRLLQAHVDAAEGAAAVVVVSHAFWQTRLGGAADAVGRTLVLNNTPFTLAGVAPANFRGVSLIDKPDFWVPASAYRAVHTGQALEYFQSRRAVTVSAFGRLKPGVTLEQAAAALKPVTQHLATAFPADNATRSLRLLPIEQTMIDPNVRADVVRAGNLLMALSATVLLVGCANLANLLLARTGARQREVALRVALGASRRQIIRQLFAEHLLLALLGGALGVVLAGWMRDLVWMLRPPGFPGDLTEITLSPGVLAFAVVATLATGLLCGLVPAIAGTRVDLIAVLKREAQSGGLGLFSFRHVLVVFQIALSVVALVVAGLFVRSLQRANVVNLGWNSQGIALFSAGLAREGYDQTRSLDYYDRAIARLRAMPGVVDASVSTRPLLTGVNPQRTIRPQGSPDDKLRTRGQLFSYACVLPNYLRFLGVHVVAGRDFTEDDDAKRPAVVIVNESFARRAWPGEDPVGKTVKLYNSEDPVQVVGVIPDIRDADLKADPAPFAFFPLRQQFTGNNAIHVRVSGDATEQLPLLRQELQALDRGVTLYASATYADIIRSALWGQRTGAKLMIAFGLTALFLAALGIYAVMAQGVLQRTREIGIRLALGAQSHAVLGLILRRGVFLAGVGLLVGLGTSFALTRYIRSFLFGVEPADPPTFAAIALVLSAVALLACYIPARRATRVDPLVALRND